MEPPTVRIDLEVDILKGHELGASLGKQGDVKDGVTNLEAGDVEGPGSYLSVQLTTIQCINRNYSLFVWHTLFHPSVGRRFQNAVLTVKLTQKSPNPELVSGTTSGGTVPKVSILQYAPRKSFGGATKESKSIHWGLELPIMAPTAGLLGAGFKPLVDGEVAVEIDHAFVIQGSSRGMPHKNTLVWTLEENKSAKRGLPSEVRFAALIEHSQPLLCEVSASGWSIGGLRPPQYLKTKTPREARTLEIDPIEYIGKLTEFDLDQDGSRCQDLLLSWTGQVEKAVLEFDQIVIRS